jgi:hypothetical protein
MTDTEQLWKEYQRERRRQADDRDCRAGRMSAAKFARVHGLNPYCLRIKMRKAKYKRKGRNLIPIADLEKFLK